MKMHPMGFNDLSNSEIERYVYLIEECSEVIKAATKILRHGRLSKDPTITDPDRLKDYNIKDLTYEIADLQFAIELLIKNEDINKDTLFAAQNKESTMKWFHYGHRV